MTLIIRVNLVDASGSSRLESDHLAIFREFFGVGGVLQFAVPFVARALFGVLAAVKAGASRGAPRLFLVNFYVLVECYI